MNKASTSRSVKESIAKLEEQLFEAEKIGNTRKVRAIKNCLKRLKSGMDISNAITLHKRVRKEKAT